jgi:hypothetical protein
MSDMSHKHTPRWLWRVLEEEEGLDFEPQPSALRRSGLGVDLGKGSGLEERPEAFQSSSDPALELRCCSGCSYEASRAGEVLEADYCRAPAVGAEGEGLRDGAGAALDLDLDQAQALRARVR